MGLLDVQQACERIGGRKFVQVRAGVQHLVCEVVRDETSPAVYENLNFDDECSTAWGLANLVARETVTDDADAAVVVVVECLQPT